MNGLTVHRWMNYSLDELKTLCEEIGAVPNTPFLSIAVKQNCGFIDIHVHLDGRPE